MKFWVVRRFGTRLGLAAGLTGVLVAVLGSNSYAAPVVSNVGVSVTVNSSCGIEADNLTKTQDFVPGTHAQIGGDTTLTINCNDANGYSIYAVVLVKMRRGILV